MRRVSKCLRQKTYSQQEASLRLAATSELQGLSTLYGILCIVRGPIPTLVEDQNNIRMSGWIERHIRSE